MGALLESIGFSGWALHALIWLPVLGVGLVLWAEERLAKQIAFWWSLVWPASDWSSASSARASAKDADWP